MATKLSKRRGKCDIRLISKSLFLVISPVKILTNSPAGPNVQCAKPDTPGTPGLRDEMNPGDLPELGPELNVSCESLASQIPLPVEAEPLSEDDTPLDLGTKPSDSKPPTTWLGYYEEVSKAYTIARLVTVNGTEEHDYLRRQVRSKLGAGPKVKLLQSHSESWWRQQVIVDMLEKHSPE
jgi:hypothetical protein